MDEVDPTQTVEGSRGAELSDGAARLTPADLEVLHGEARRFAAVVGDLDMDPEDLVQDAMLKLVEHADDVEDPKAYLFACIRNRVVELRRSAASRRQRLSSIDLALPDVVLDDHRIELHGLLDAMSPSDRALLYLVFVEGWPQGDLASFMDVPPATIRKRVSRARRRFARADDRRRSER